MFTYKVMIKEQHIDTLGHMNNAVYLALYEEARWEKITSQGYGIKQMLEYKKGPVILDVTVKFLKEIHLRETITITAEVISSNGKIGKFAQKMIKEDGSVASEALFTIAFFDLESRKLIPPTPEWLKAIE
jgi:YbgC/YbaW family acyl-CoA thioester hydrolase